MLEQRVLSLDQATNCGFCVGENGEFIGRGVISSDKKGFNFIISDIKQQTIGLIEAYQPDLVTIEEVHYNPTVGSKVYGLLKMMQGVLINYFIENEILYEVIKPSQWQGNEGFKGKNKKKQSLDKAIELFDDEKLDGNTADAVWMCKYAMEHIKIICE